MCLAHLNKTSQVLYLYDSVFGYGLVIMRMVGWLMFIYATFFTLKHYPEKGGFYYPFFCFYTLWFVASPCVIILGNNIIEKWVREKVSPCPVSSHTCPFLQVVSGVEHAVALVGHSVFLVLTRPGWGAAVLASNYQLLYLILAV